MQLNSRHDTLKLKDSIYNLWQQSCVDKGITRVSQRHKGQLTPLQSCSNCKIALIEGLVSSGIACTSMPWPSSSLWSNVGSCDAFSGLGGPATVTTCNVWAVAASRLFELLVFVSLLGIDSSTLRKVEVSAANVATALLICLTWSCSWLWFTERLLTMYLTKWLAVLLSLIQRLNASANKI